MFVVEFDKLRHPAFGLTGLLVAAVSNGVLVHCPLLQSPGPCFCRVMCHSSGVVLLLCPFLQSPELGVIVAFAIGDSPGMVILMCPSLQCPEFGAIVAFVIEVSKFGDIAVSLTAVSRAWCCCRPLGQG